MVLLRALGWETVRSAGSHGEADIWAAKSGYPLRLIQVKSNVAGPYAHFGPAERRTLLEQGKRTGADVELCWWPPRKQPKFIPPEDWPAFD